MTEWWTALSLEQQIYWGIALLCSALVLMQTALALVGADGLDGAMDFDIGDAGHPSGIGILSWWTIMAFGVGFGWAGVVALEEGWSTLQAGMLASGVGAFSMFLVFHIMRFLYRMRHSGTVDFANAIGQAASVYIPIPPEMSGNGQVTLTVQGRFRVLSACTAHSERLAAGTHVQVVEVLDNNVLLVEPALQPAHSD